MRLQLSQCTSSPRLSCCATCGRTRVRQALHESLITGETAIFARWL